MEVHTIGRDPSPEHAHEIRMEVLRSEINNLSPDQLEHSVGQLEEKMGLTCKGDRFAPLTNGFRQFFRDDELDANGMPQNVDLDRILEQKRRLVNLFSELYHRSSELGVKDQATLDINGDEFRLSFRMMRLIETADDAYEIIFRYVRSFERINHPTCTAPVTDDVELSMFRCKTMDDGEDDNQPSPFQCLLLYLLNKAYIMKMRRYKGQCCKQIETSDGHLTKAWKPIMEIKEFVYFYTQKEDKYDMWRNLTSKGSIVKDTITHLSNCRDMQFPEIKKNRYVWSFRNGILIGKEWDGEKYVSRFYGYDTPACQALDPTIVSCKYFDQDFDHYGELADWYTIPTPHMQTVMDYQRFNEDVCRWLYVFIGRLCFDVGDMDSWQVIPFLKGIARSGKSTLITKVCKKFYDTEDVRTLSNNIEKKFGLWSIHDGFMFISPEVKGDLALEQAEFQSMVSGEDVSIARKNDKALSMTWNVPGILAGNEVPGYRDNSGSVLRRLVTWNFGRQVAKADPKLDEKLDAEIPAIVCKCIRAYLEYSQRHNNEDIWNVLPEYFKGVQSEVAKLTNPLQHFLSSEKMVFGQDKFIPQKLFISAFNAHCIENLLGRCKFNPDIYAGPFSAREIEVRTDTCVYNGTAYTAQAVIYGLDIVASELANGDV
jgi:NOL1/NOP2/fmu family ribosome biogenesis protein